MNQVRVTRIGNALNVSEVNHGGLVVNSIVVEPRAIGPFLDDIDNVKSKDPRQKPPTANEEKRPL